MSSINHSLHNAKNKLTSIAKDVVSDAKDAFSEAKDVAIEAKHDLEKKGTEALGAIGLQPKKSSAFPVIAAFGVGALLAGGLVLFLSPKTGKQMRGIALGFAAKAIQKLPMLNAA